MTKAGDYDTLFRWIQLSKTKDSTFGEMLETTGTGQPLWGYIEKLTGRRMQELGLTGNVVQTVIRIRNYPEVQFNDTLIDQRYNITYVVETVARGDDELVITAHADEA